jgi:hypothetical protein
MGQDTPKRPENSAASTSPFEQLFGGREELKERQRTIEAFIAQCMTAKGWRYTPRNVATMFVGFDSTADEDSFQAAYGYGISIPAGTTGAPVTGAFVDTNADYVSSLSETERQAYQTDLEGKSFRADAGSATDESPPLADRTGCDADAERAAGPTPLDNAEVNEVFGKLMDDVEHDSRNVVANEMWSRCMKAAGFTYEKSGDIFKDLNMRLQALRTNDDGSPVGSDASSSTAAAATSPGNPIRGEPAIGGSDRGHEPDPAELQKLQTLELATAKADRTCADKHLTKIRRQFEREVADAIVKQFPGLNRK